MLLLIGNQGMYQKFFSARSEKDARRAVGGWIVGTVILETLLITLSVVGSSKFHPDNPREIMLVSARLGLPSLVGAILLGGIFAKVIATANNFLFSPASNLIHDVYERFLAKKRNAASVSSCSCSVIILTPASAKILSMISSFSPTSPERAFDK